MSFIENISPETLHMTEDEFDGLVTMVNVTSHSNCLFFSYLASNDLLESPGENLSETPQTDSDPLTVLKVELEKCGLDLPTDEELQPNEDDITVPDVELFEPLRIMRVCHRYEAVEENYSVVLCMKPESVRWTIWTDRQTHRQWTAGQTERQRDRWTMVILHV